MIRESKLDLLRQFSTLLDFSNDMSRNRDDTEWSDSGKEIIYVLDTSVFSSFIYPQKWHPSMSVISWFKADRDSARDVSFREGYSAMIAAEYLVSVKAPGSRSSDIYLSPWHAAELHHFIENEYETLVKKIHLASKAGSKKLGLEDEVRQKRELVMQARKQGAGKNRDVDRADLTRRAAKIILESDIAEPLDQIYRLTSKDVRNRFRTLNERFPLTDEELPIFQADARLWFERISEKFETHKPKERRKKPASVWNDAFTIAYIIWLSTNKLRDDQRLVFVTADTGIFDVYRQWFIDRDISNAEFYYPFVFRRLSQYAPIINLIDASSDIKEYVDTREEEFSIFDDISNSIEMALIPFNLSTTGKGSHDRKSEMLNRRGRELLALGSRDETFASHRETFGAYTHFLPDEWYNDQHERIQSIGNLWRSLQDTATGLFFNLVKRRIDDDFGISVDDIDALEQVGGRRNTIEYFKRLAQELSQETTQSALESAQTIIRKSEYRDGIDARRLPRSIWYELSEDVNVEKYLSLWRQSVRQEVAQTSLRSSPTTVFVLAAAISLSQSDWTNADVYSKRALRSSKAETLQQIAEVKFLRALCCRFSMGTISAHLEGSKGLTSDEVVTQCHKIIQQSYLEGSQLLEQIIKPLEEAPVEPTKNKRLLRAVSELIATKMFYFSSVGASPFRKPLDKTQILLGLSEDVHDLLEQCEQIIADTDTKDSEFQYVESQYLINAAALHVLEFVFKLPGKYNDPAVLDTLHRRHIRSSAIKLANRSPIVRAEVNAFMLMTGRENTFSELEKALVEGRSSALALDSALCRKIDEAKLDLVKFRYRNQ